MFGLENFDWGALVNKLGSPEMGVAYGQAAQAITPPGSIPNALGGVGTGMNKSQIAAKEAKAQEERQRLYDAAFIRLAGLGMTDKDQVGGTNLTFGPNGEFTYKGKMGEGTMPFSANPSLASPGGGGLPGATSIAPTTPTTQSRGNIGDLLANFQDSPAGGGVDLAGLSPEEINAFMSQRTATSNLNLNKAKALHDMNAPTTGQIVAGPKFYWKIDPITGKATKTEVPAYHAPVYPPGHAAANTPKIVQWWDADGKSHTTSMLPRQHNEFAAAVEKVGGQLGEQPGQITEKTKFEEDRAKRHVIANVAIAKEHKSDTAREAVYESNRTAPDEAISYWTWKEPGFLTPGSYEGALKKTLPVVKGRQLDMGYVRKVMSQLKINSIENAIAAIQEVNK